MKQSSDLIYSNQVDSFNTNLTTLKYKLEVYFLIFSLSVREEDYLLTIISITIIS